MAIRAIVTGSCGVRTAEATIRTISTIFCFLNSVPSGTISVHAMNMTTSGVWNTTPKIRVIIATNLK